MFNLRTKRSDGTRCPPPPPDPPDGNRRAPRRKFLGPAHSGHTQLGEPSQLQTDQRAAAIWGRRGRSYGLFLFPPQVQKQYANVCLCSHTNVHGAIRAKKRRRKRKEVSHTLHRSVKVARKSLQVELRFFIRRLRRELLPL